MTQFPLLALALLALCPALSATTYYVDYASGSDQNDGLSDSSAWKHAPGDPQAEAKPASVKLVGGDAVLFKGGVVYRGRITMDASGEPGARIAYKGNGWGEKKAIIDGSDLITGWQQCTSAEDAGGNPNFRQLFFAYIPEDRSPFLVNLHETEPATQEDSGLFLSQSPNPEDFFFFNKRDGLHPVKHENLTLESITSPDFFTQSDADHWAGSSILVWVNPNFTERSEIKAFIPSENKIILATPLRSNAIYKDGRDQYFAIYNSAQAIDIPGEYAVMPANAEGMRKVVLWPRNPAELDQRISGTVRKTGIETRGQSHVEIDGFEIRKFGSDVLREGNGIIAYGGHNVMRTDIVLRNNHIYQNKHGSKGYGGIYVQDVTHALIEDNYVVRNQLHTGIFLSGCEDSILRNNKIEYPGKGGLTLYTCKRVQVVNNELSNIYATHANGLTMYIGCEDILIANNAITKAVTPITFQDSGNLYFINNVTDGQDEYKNVNEWPMTRRDSAKASGKVVFLNNTFVHAGSDSALSLGQDDNNEYIVMNNILDGMSFSQKKSPKLTLHAYNMFVGRGYSQTDQYGWTDGEGEMTTEAPLDTIFVDPAALNFHLKPGSPAINAGTDVSEYYPTEKFPDFNFETDITGTPRTGWSLGAYAAD